jgi:hypothetical protein
MECHISPYLLEIMRCLALHFFAGIAKPLGGLGDDVGAVAASQLVGWFGGEVVVVGGAVAREAGLGGVAFGLLELRGLGSVELAGQSGCVLAADAEGDGVAGITKDGGLQAV